MFRTNRDLVFAQLSAGLFLLASACSADTSALGDSGEDRDSGLSDLGASDFGAGDALPADAR